MSEDMTSMPCSFCCKTIEFPRRIITEGGLARCKYCGMAVKFKKRFHAEDKPTRRKGNGTSRTSTRRLQ